MLKEIYGVKVRAYTYDKNPNYLILIVYLEDCFDCYFKLKGYGDFVHMFGLDEEYYEEAEYIVAANIDEYIAKWEEYNL